MYKVYHGHQNWSVFVFYVWGERDEGTNTHEQVNAATPAYIHQNGQILVDELRLDQGLLPCGLDIAYFETLHVCLVLGHAHTAALPLRGECEHLVHEGAVHGHGVCHADVGDQHVHMDVADALLTEGMFDYAENFLAAAAASEERVVPVLPGEQVGMHAVKTLESTKAILHFDHHGLHAWLVELCRVRVFDFAADVGELEGMGLKRRVLVWGHSTDGQAVDGGVECGHDGLRIRRDLVKHVRQARHMQVTREFCVVVGVYQQAKQSEVTW